MYSGDSFFTLSAAGRTGLAVLSFVLAVGYLWTLWRVAQGARALARLVLGLGAFWLLEWLSPQLYYIYYLLLFDLPVQIVIGWPPGPVQLWRLLTFCADPTLSAHGRGLLGLSGLGVCLVASRRSAPRMARKSG